MCVAVGMCSGTWHGVEVGLLGPQGPELPHLALKAFNLLLPHPGVLSPWARALRDSPVSSFTPTALCLLEPDCLPSFP